MCLYVKVASLNIFVISWFEIRLLILIIWQPTMLNTLPVS